MERFSITKQQARRFILAHQGLWPPRKLRGKAGIMEYIRRVGCIQFDPLNIAGYNHELVLQARISGFKPVMLQELLYKNRKLLDGWDKNMSIYCIEDWPYFCRRRELHRDRIGTEDEIAAVIPKVLEEITARGPLSSNDLDYKESVDWWWAPTRISRAALESLYFWGELVIHHKQNTRRIFDLACRHIPPELFEAPEPNETIEQYHDWYVKRRIGAIGMLWNKAGDGWLGMSDIKSRERSEAISRLLASGELVELAVEGISVPLYMRNEDLPLLENIMQDAAAPVHASVIAPLDNLIWERRLVKELFDFDYRWEVYKPAEEREYGYYVLPVLYGDRFAARFEPGWDKSTGSLVIKNWWWEPGVRQTKKLQKALLQCFAQFLRYLEANGLIIEESARTQAGLDWLKEMIP